MGDLRYCIEQAQDEDRIQFAVKGTINLTRVLPNLTRNISIDGPGAGLLTVRRDTGGEYSIFTVARSASVTLFGLTVTGGFGGIVNLGSLDLDSSAVIGNGTIYGAGGGIHNLGTLRVVNSTVSGNRAWSDVEASGGGIHNEGTLTVSNSTLSYNQVQCMRCFAEGGGIANRGMAILSNSTLAGNTVVSSQQLKGLSHAIGGGVYNAYDAGPLYVLSSTIAGNETSCFLCGAGGGGIANYGGSETFLRNTIVSGNRHTIGANDVDGRLVSLGHNLIGNSRGGSGYDPTDLLDIDPLLGPLQDNGGPTWTHALLEGSPAIDAGDNTDVPEFDQRGFARIVNGTIDIGAFEVQPPAAFLYLWPDSGTVSAGAPFDLYVFALDVQGELVPDYPGEVAFWSTDPAAALPGPYTFRPADGGLAYFAGGVTFNTPGVQELYAFDTASYSMWGYAAYEVLGAAPGRGVGNRGASRPAAPDPSTAEALTPRRGAARPTPGAPAVAPRCQPASGAVADEEDRPLPAVVPLRAEVAPSPALARLLARPVDGWSPALIADARLADG